MRIVRGVIALAAFVALFYIISGLSPIDGPPLFPYLALTILPIVAAVAIAPRTIRFAFLAGAIYAGLAGVRAMLAPAGNVTIIEQLSTAALVALLVPILARLWGWIVGLKLRTSAKS